MAVKILVHGSGHKAESWDKTLSHMQNNGDIMCPSLASILEGKEASYENLYASFANYCGRVDGQIHLCGLSLGGILALNYALDLSLIHIFMNELSELLAKRSKHNKE